MVGRLLVVVACLLGRGGASPQPPPDVVLFFSEYGEGTSNNKYLEIYNAGTATASLDRFAFPSVANGPSSPGVHEYWNTFTAGASLAPGEVYVIAHGGAAPAILTHADQTFNFLSNGNDGFALAYGEETDHTILDAIGDFSRDPGVAWSVCGRSGGTKDHTLVRKPGVATGNRGNWAASAGTNVDDCEWVVHPVNTWTFLGSHLHGPSQGDPPTVAPRPSPSRSLCSGAASPIGLVQGGGSQSALAGSSVTVKGVVTASLQQPDGLGGYFLQDAEAGDGDPATSDGIFVYDTSVSVARGDFVMVSGKVKEHHGLTQLQAVTDVQLCGKRPVPFPVLIDRLPTRNDADAAFEPFEGMLVMLAEPTTVTELYGLGRYGEMTLSSSGRNIIPSQVVDPLSAAHQRMYSELRDTLTLDDGSTKQYPDPIPFPGMGMNSTNIVRVGDVLTNVVGPLSYAYGKWRLHAAPGFPKPAVNHANPRPSSPPNVGGAIKVVGYNVLNFFNGPDPGLPFSDSRNYGADSVWELYRQRNKTISALLAMDASVIGLSEVENDGFGPNSAVQDIAGHLNAAAGVVGKYVVVDPGVDRVGASNIMCAVIYQPSRVRIVGAPALLTSRADPDFLAKNRPSLAVSFEEQSTRSRFTVAVNHFKSKGSSCLSCCNDPEITGVGHCNGVRARAAGALGRWLGTYPTGIGTNDILLIGDMNSHHFETPIQTLIKDFGYVDAVDRFHSKEASWSMVYRGLSGYLDHALASPSLVPQITGVQEWHINADESPVLDYNLENKSPSQVDQLYDAGAFRSSDHDPILIGLFPSPSTCQGTGPRQHQDQNLGSMRLSRDISGAAR